MRKSRAGLWCGLAAAMLGASIVPMAGCSRQAADEQAQQESMEAGKAIGMKQAEMMKQGKMGMPKTGQ